MSKFVQHLKEGMREGCLSAQEPIEQRPARAAAAGARQQTPGRLAAGNRAGRTLDSTRQA